jgi:dTDP-4-amino-4,6-dideoxygalactose transaminase/nucleoside-diphosphate-sugar epimerase
MEKEIKLIRPRLYDFEKFSQRAKQIFDGGHFTNNGPFLQEFESKVSSFLGVPTIALSNGTSALLHVLKLLKPKGNVILPSFTFCATAHAVDWAGLTPNFADIDLETFNIDPKKVRELINENTVAILAVHVFGNPCNIKELSEIAKEHGIPLIFDSAHAFGSKYQDRNIGQFGDYEIFSTHATKVLNSVEGGLIATYNTNLHKLKAARNFGMDGNPEDTAFIGTNSKMSELHAIVGIDSIDNLQNNLEIKKSIVKEYLQNLKETPGISFQKINPLGESNYFFFSIIVDPDKYGLNRDQLAQILAEKGIQARKYFHLPLHQHTSHKSSSLLNLPNTEKLSKNILCLPTHTDLTIEDVKYVCEVINQSKKDIVQNPITIQNDVSNQVVPEGKINKRVLVTGGAGYVGCVLVKKLLEQGYFVRVLDQLIFGKEPLKEFMNNPNFDLEVGLVEDKYTVEKCMENINFVIHLSGLSNDPSCELNSDLTTKANVDSTKILLQIAKSNNVQRFINASSCSVYGFTEGKFVDEKNELNPLTAYARSKVASENAVLAQACDDFVTVSLRKATIYGPSPRMRFDLVINTMTGMGLSEGKLVINGGEQWRPFLHVEDAADAYIFMINAPKEKINGQSFNVGSNEQNMKIIDLAYKIAETIPSIRVEQSPSPDNRSYRVNFNKINSIGWTNKFSIEDGILGVKRMFDTNEIQDFRNLNYFNIKRMISYLNI